VVVLAVAVLVTLAVLGLLVKETLVEAEQAVRQIMVVAVEVALLLLAQMEHQLLLAMVVLVLLLQLRVLL
jgi:hypothetical protein